MPTFFSDENKARLFDFAVALATAARLFTAEQLARRPELSGYRDPVKRAREFLALYPDVFETVPSPMGVPARRRLTAKERRKRGIHYRAVSGVSQRAEHWLGIGNIWIELTSHGGRPTEWKTEPDAQFDVYCVWRGQPMLIEYQRTPITQKMWQRKWERRREWYRLQAWEKKPRVVLINTTGQQEDIVCLPRGTIHVRRIDQLHHALRTLR
jgi:hypothetical protein